MTNLHPSTIDSATRPRPLVYERGVYPRGSYVLAMKYSDGDPGDGWFVGFYYGAYDHFGIQMRHIVVGSDGHTARHNGFRRVERISTERGNWIVTHAALIQRMMSRYSMLHWLHASWAELNEVAAFEALDGR